MASLGVRGGMRQGGRSGLYGWQSCRTRVEVSGSLPGHAMWGSDGRVEWKERGAHRSLAAVKGNMNRIFCSLAVLLWIFLFVCIPYTLFSCFFFCHKLKEVFVVVGCLHISTERCRPATRTTEASFLFHCFLRM